MRRHENLLLNLHLESLSSAEQITIESNPRLSACDLESLFSQELIENAEIDFQENADVEACNP